MWGCVCDMMYTYRMCRGLKITWQCSCSTLCIPGDNASLLTKPSRWPSLIFPIGVTDFFFHQACQFKRPT